MHKTIDEVWEIDVTVNHEAADDLKSIITHP